MVFVFLVGCLHGCQHSGEAFVDERDLNEKHIIDNTIYKERVCLVTTLGYPGVNPACLGHIRVVCTRESPVVVYRSKHTLALLLVY